LDAAEKTMPYIFPSRTVVGVMVDGASAPTS
jgi:hypothetical protein